jgi:pilus assembly protein CpaB
MRFIRNKFLVGLLCIILGLAVGFMALPATIQNKQVNQKEVIRLIADVGKGEYISDDLVEKTMVNSEILPDQALSILPDPEMRYAVADLFSGDILTQTKLSDQLTVQDPLLLATKKGMTVVSISLPSLASGVSGILQPGDIVSVMALMKNSTGSVSRTLQPQSQDQELSDESIKAETHTSGDSLSRTVETQVFSQLRYMEVYSMSASDGSFARVEKIPGDDKNLLPITVSLFATEDQALLLAELEQKAIIHLSLIARRENADQFIEAEQLVMSTEVEHHAD